MQSVEQCRTIMLNRSKSIKKKKVPKSYVPIYYLTVFLTSSRATLEAPKGDISSATTNLKFPAVKGTSDLSRRTVESTAD